MLYGKYIFSCIFKDEAVLPYYKGSTFRGVFGTALKKVVCALKSKDCSECLLKYKCIYSHVFETPSSAEDPQDTRIAAPPHPFVIEPPLTTETHFNQDDPFDFQLILFGQSNDYLPYFIYAFEQMGKIGIGKRINGKRAQFTLGNITAKKKKIYTHKDNTLKSGNFCHSLKLHKCKTSKNAQDIKIIIETPLRLKFENRLKADLPFHVLVRAMLRRMSSLFNYYGDGEPDLDYKGMVNKAKEIQIMNPNLHWFDWRRYSRRQDQEMLMGGITGSITYSGHLGEYIPLIELCSKLHIGKQTTFGLGKFGMEMSS
ncbi:MAG TPA: CRISPR system precrRNA processing endoribonuclease RAMP protein Cas6 [Desulfobacterales bacterium]|nr:CRISPR system precrRNA processing endoribonuclease RAMP protein Cas6 [Desulfobacterales bacterium]